MFYLKHNFDPHFDYTDLRPVQEEDGGVDHYDLGYTQNVLKGQVLAQWQEVSEEEAGKLNPDFVFEKKQDFVGKNCFVPKNNPNQIVAAANGFVLYLDGKINVKKLLNIRGDVGSKTGDIAFVGDVVVHNDVKAGFEVRGQQVRVMGRVASNCKIMANGSLVVDHGVKGAETSVLCAKETIKMDFCEYAELRAEKILLETASMHCYLYASAGLAVQGKLIGGVCYTNGSVYVGRQLGGGISTITSLVLGYHPKLLAKKMEIEQELAERKQELFALEADIRKNRTVDKDKHSALVADIAIISGHLQTIRKEINQRLNLEATVVVEGEVRPGVVVNICGAEVKINDYLQKVCFYLDGREVKWKPLG